MNVSPNLLIGSLVFFLEFINRDPCHTALSGMKIEVFSSNTIMFSGPDYN